MTNPTNKAPIASTINTRRLVGCAALLSTVGLCISVPAPAYAANKICTQYAFNGAFRFKVTEGAASFSPEFNLTGKSGSLPNVTAKPFDSDSVAVGVMHGPLTANIDGRHIEMSWQNGDLLIGGNTHWTFTGEVDDYDGIVRGGSGTRNGESITWTSDAATPLKCLEWTEPKLPSILGGGDDDQKNTGVGFGSKENSPPDVEVVKAPGSVTVTVTDKSGIDTHCTYTATPRPPTLLSVIKREFDLPANGTYSLSFIPIPTLTTWDIVVDCEGGRVTTTTEQY